MKKRNTFRRPVTGKQKRRKRVKQTCAPSLAPKYSPSPTSNSATLPTGRFIFEKTLGTGGLCAAFLCTDVLRTVWGDAQPCLVIKKLLPDYIANPKANLLLMQEFCLARQLTHPNIIRVYDIHQIIRHEPRVTDVSQRARPHDGAPLSRIHKGDENILSSPRTTRPQSSSSHDSIRGGQKTSKPAPQEKAQAYELAMTMELLEGPSLADLIHTYPHGMGKKALPLARQLLSAVHYLHSRGIAHGDIKPANITVEPGNRLVLFDFNSAMGGLLPGMAQQAEDQRLRADLRLKTHTPLYASPERIERGIPSLEDDIFTLACTLFHLAYGTRPYVSDNSLAAMRMGQTPQKPLVILPKAVHKLLCRSLSFDPASRPTSGRWVQTLANYPLAARRDTSYQHHGQSPNLFRRLLWPVSHLHP